MKIELLITQFLNSYLNIIMYEIRLVEVNKFAFELKVLIKKREIKLQCLSEKRESYLQEITKSFRHHVYYFRVVNLKQADFIINYCAKGINHA